MPYGDLLRQSGNQIVSASTGERLPLWGPHLFWFTHQYQNNGASARNESLDWLHTMLATPQNGGWGSTLISKWVDTVPTLQQWGNYIPWFDDAVSMCEQYNAYILLAWHNDFGQQGHSKMLDEDGIQAMEFFADRYSGNPHVLFTPQAEPPGDERVQSGPNIRWGDGSAGDFKVVTEEFFDRIRAIYPDAFIGVAGLRWSQQFGPFLSNPVERPNFFVKPHIYGSVPGRFDGTNTYDMYNAGYPVVIGEFGPGAGSNMGDAERVLEESWDWQYFGWQGWSSSPASHGGSPNLLNTANINDLTSWGVMLRDHSQFWFNNVDNSVISTPTDPAHDPYPNIDPGPNAEWLVESGTRHWSDWSWGGTSLTGGPDWLTVEHTQTGQTGAQFRNASPFNTANWSHLMAVLEFDPETLDEDGPISSTLFEDEASGETQSARPGDYIAQTWGADWYGVLIPLSAYDPPAQFQRVQFMNISGAVLTYRIRSLALVHVNDSPVFTDPESTPPSPITQPDPPPDLDPEKPVVNPGPGAHVVVDEGQLQSPWQNWSWGGTELTETADGLEVDMPGTQASAQFTDTDGFSTGDFGEVFMVAAISPGVQDSLSNYFYLGTTGDASSSTVAPLSGFISHLWGDWYEMRIPMGEFNLGGATAYRYEIQSTGGAHTWVIWHLALVAEGQSPDVSLPGPQTHAPVESVGAGDERITHQETLHWENWSWGATIQQTPGVDAVRVHYHREDGSGGFQLNYPPGTISLSPFTSVFLVVWAASSSVLQGIRARYYTGHEGESWDNQIPLADYAVHVGNNWFHVDIPPSALGNAPAIARIELHNNMAASALIYVGQWTLYEQPPRAGLVVTVQPEDTPAGATIGGPPTVRAEREGEVLDGVEITVTLNQGSFTGDSTTTVTTDSNGEAVFDNLRITAPDAGYRLRFSAPEQ